MTLPRFLLTTQNPSPLFSKQCLVLERLATAGTRKRSSSKILGATRIFPNPGTFFPTSKQRIASLAFWASPSNWGPRSHSLTSDLLSSANLSACGSLDSNISKCFLLPKAQALTSICNIHLFLLCIHHTYPRLLVFTCAMTTSGMPYLYLTIYNPMFKSQDTNTLKFPTNSHILQ